MCIYSLEMSRLIVVLVSSLWGCVIRCSRENDGETVMFEIVVDQYEDCFWGAYILSRFRVLYDLGHPGQVVDPGTHP
jgi:hypothetical protein